MKNMHKTFDFRTILFLDLIIMIFMLLSGKPEVVLSSFFIASIVLAVGGQYISLMRYGVIFIGLYFYYHIITYAQIPLIQRIIPFLMLGTAIRKQKNLSEITTALERCRLPKGIILSISVMFRNFASLKEDFFTISDAMKLKGIDTSRKGIVCHPLRLLEYIFVPMLFRSLRTAEEFSCAALVKGIENKNRRSSYFDVRIRKKDIIISVIAVAMLIAGMKLKLYTR